MRNFFVIYACMDFSNLDFDELCTEINSIFRECVEAASCRRMCICASTSPFPMEGLSVRKGRHPLGPWNRCPSVPRNSCAISFVSVRRKGKGGRPAPPRGVCAHLPCRLLCSFLLFLPLSTRPTPDFCISHASQSCSYRPSPH